jgi:hypothetical protein
LDVSPIISTEDDTAGGPQEHRAAVKQTFITHR